MKINDFIDLLGADFYTGVPDSLLRPLSDYIYSIYGVDNKHHIIAANEGNAVAMGAGYYLATGKVPVIYMQNSGEGNIINPLASLMSSDVYAIPAIFIIGWRGEPGISDEPQHAHQGRVTLSLLECMGISYFVLKKNITVDELKDRIDQMKKDLDKGKQIAFVISKGALENEEKINYTNNNILTREEIIKAIADAAGDCPVISTTGKASRELFEYRESLGRSHGQDFLTVGSMGHSSSIAVGIAQQKDNKRIWCIDGDGAAIMHMGAMATIGSLHLPNFIHVIIDNGAHDSVGGMPTAARKIDFVQIAKGCGYDNVYQAVTMDELQKSLDHLNQHRDGLCLLLVKAAIGSRKDLGRPTVRPIDNKKMFMDFVAV